MITLEKPSLHLVPSFIGCLDEGKFGGMQLGFGDLPKAQIETDPEAYIALITEGRPFTYAAQGKEYVVRDHELLWIADGDRFLGTVALRYDGDAELIESYAGHIGMAIRPALLNKGYGVRAIQNMHDMIVEKFRQKSLRNIYATCDVDNDASRRLIEHFGGVLVAEEDVFGKGPSLRYRISAP